MIKTRREKDLPLSHDELDDNFGFCVNTYENQNVDGIKTFIKTPTAPTPDLLDDSTSVANTAFVQAKINILKNQLDTLSSNATNYRPVNISLTLPTPTLILFGTLSYVIGGNMFLCAANSATPTSDSDCFWVQI